MKGEWFRVQKGSMFRAQCVEGASKGCRQAQSRLESKEPLADGQPTATMDKAHVSFTNNILFPRSTWHSRVSHAAGIFVIGKQPTFLGPGIQSHHAEGEDWAS